MLILPQINFVLFSVYCPPYILQQIDKMITQFVWNKKPSIVKRGSVIANYTDGGLRMPDIFAIHATAKIKWIKKLLSEPCAL